jgi:PadR family transcriptional regulator, regulatory protein PadR
MKHDLIRGHLDLLLLSVLAERPAHGYAIIEALRSRSDGHFSLPEGTVYPALHRLEAAGLLKSKEAMVEGRRRRTYSVTNDGRHAIVERAAEWRTFAGSVEAVLGGAQ